MNHTWNEALEAYDRELPMLNALRHEYLGYIRERLRAAHALIEGDLAGRALLDIATDEDPDAGAEIRFVDTHARAVTGIQCQVWPSADEGGEPGYLHWAMLVPTHLPKGFGDSRRVVAEARNASNAVATLALSDAPPQVSEFSSFACVRWGRVRLADPDLAKSLAITFRSVLKGMEGAADAVLATRSI